MEWRIKLEATSGWGEVETIEVAHFKRRIVGLKAEEIGLEEEKTNPGRSAAPRASDPGRVAFCARFCPACLKTRRQRHCRTLTIQKLFGTVTVEAPRMSICPCSSTMGFVDYSFS